METSEWQHSTPQAVRDNKGEMLMRGPLPVDDVAVFTIGDYVCASWPQADGSILVKYSIRTPTHVDPVVEANRKALLERSQRGVAKYGSTLGSFADERAILVHAKEEALDLANYLQTRIMQIDGEIIDE